MNEVISNGINNIRTDVSSHYLYANKNNLFHLKKLMFLSSPARYLTTYCN